MKDKKRKRGCNKKKKNRSRLDSKTLIYSTYTVAFFDFLSAMLISVVTVKMLITKFEWFSMFMLVFSIFWTSVIFLLIIGVWKKRPKFVRCWILFSCIGIVIEMFLILYGLFERSTINWDRMEGVLLLFAGLVMESVFVYIVYRFYVRLCKECAAKKKGRSPLCRKSRSRSRDSGRKKKKRSRSRSSKKSKSKRRK